MAELIRSGPVPLCGAETSSSLQLAHHYGLEASSRCVRSSRRYGVRTPRRSEPGWVQPQLDDFASFALGASLGLATFAKRLRRQAMKKEDWREFRAKLVEQETGATVEVQDEGWLHRGTLLEKGCLLIACPGDRYALDQQYFHKAVILIIKRDQSGDVGVILNRPTRWNLQDADEANLFQAAEGELRRLFGLVREVRPWKVSYGGPMGSTGSNVICLHRSSGLKEGDEVLSGLFLLPFGYARDLVSLGLAPQEDFHLISGYCGWGPGQLEEELRNGSWQLLCADCKAILPSSPTCSPDGIDYWQRFQDALQMTPDEHAAQNAHVGDAALQRWILEHCESTREKRPSREDPMRRIEVASRIQAGTVLRGSASAWILGGSSEMRPRRNEQSRPPAQYLHKAVLLAISDASTEQAPVLVILTGPRVGELPAFGGEEVYFGGLVPSEQQLIQVAGSYIWGQVVFSLPVLEELLQSGALELAPGVRVHEVMSAPRTSRWTAAGGRLESINDAAAALLGDDQQRHWYQRYLGLSVEKL